ncbi:hypothetical protein E0Z10_g1871 [Xylaria hypoxylon]|uniref:Uncharacterized protein n=1 Tax=Xylaria hypoxylon TaxID=37992 RepID=A0A4Z0Z5K4_9PEZI|nr:hypothetical protein E0Z10_g1871 [Xylaria hypoxylon]
MSGQEDMMPMFRHPASGSQNMENADIDIFGSPYGRASLSNGVHNSMSRHSTNGSPGTRNGSVRIRESAIDQGPSAVSRGSHMPALREIRVKNVPGSPNIAQKRRPPADCEQLDVFFEALGEFLAAISKTQSEVGGISSVVAEYINWMQKGPMTIPSGSSITNFAMMLQRLEARVKEVHDLAETRHLEAWNGSSLQYPNMTAW